MRHANRLATKRTVAAMRAGGRLEAIDEGAIAAALTTADLVDEAVADVEVPSYARAAVVRAHLAALAALTGKDQADVDEGTAAIIAALSTPMGHTAD
jgi:hypothetical protein